MVKLHLLLLLKKIKKIPRFFIEHTDERVIYYIKKYLNLGPMF